MLQVDTVLLKVASKCNINCTYCYVYNMGDDGWRDMPNLMTRSTVSGVAKALGELVGDQSRPFATVLHGGEPLMLGPRRLQQLLEVLRKVLPDSHKICMQSNGMLLTREIADICAASGVSISISLDGPQDVNDRFRKDKRGDGTHARVATGIRVLLDHPASESLFAGILSVIDPTSDPVSVYCYLKSLQAPSIDFLYRDGNHSIMPYGKADFESIEYGAWLSALLDTYLADPDPPRVRVLDDMIRLLLGGSGVKEGLGARDYVIFIVETDGTISKNDTLKSSFNRADRFAEHWHVGSTRFLKMLETYEFNQYQVSQKATAVQCRTCPHVAVCGGGMPLHRWSKEASFDNPSVYCNDQKFVIDSILRHLRAEHLLTDV